MKKICWVVIILTVFVNISVAQKTKDNTIIVNGYVSYNQIKDSLAIEGFTPLNSDTTVITTNFRNMGMAATLFNTPGVAYLIKRTDTSVIFKGYVRNKVTVVIGVDITAHTWPLENWGEKKAVFRMGFALMGKIANSFGLPVTYLKEEIKKKNK